ncbi:MAG TPA: EAL domain-containing protein [Paraburkholderia sp.]|jgi:EAL domain-containing protein (putative c-di-GMP-specific phosphodiesterase class I)|nr:EAL domain-containing protein [Paraburkholderia sp.]
MIALTIPELVARASEHPFLGEHLAMGSGTRHTQAVARRAGLELCSAYEPIYDVTVHGLEQSLTSEPISAARFGDELGFQAVTLRTESAPQGMPADATPSVPCDPFSLPLDDPELVAFDRMIRALHAINFFGSRQHGLLFLRVHERLLKSVKYDHGRHFSNVLVSFGLNPGRIVIELPSAAVAHRTFLGYLVQSYQRYGFKVAGNLPNAGQILAISDMARLDFVKMDANTALRDSMVKPLVSYASRLRIPLIFSRVADAAQFDLLLKYDVRFVQGPLFAARELIA